MVRILELEVIDWSLRYLVCKKQKIGKHLTASVYEPGPDGGILEHVLKRKPQAVQFAQEFGV